MSITTKRKQARLLLDRISDEIERWVSDENDPLYGLHVIVERDDRGSHPTIHVRCRTSNVERKKKKQSKMPTAE